MRKRREGKSSSVVLGLNNRKDEVAIYSDGEHLRETGLGGGRQEFDLGLVTFEIPYIHLN